MLNPSSSQTLARPILAVQTPVCTTYESTFVSELHQFTKEVDGTYRHDVLGFVFN